MKNKIKKWFIIFSIIWIVFWIIDIFYLVPMNGTFSETVTGFFTDPDDFSLVWVGVTAPIQLMIFSMGLYKGLLFIKNKVVRIKNK